MRDSILEDIARKAKNEINDLDSIERDVLEKEIEDNFDEWLLDATDEELLQYAVDKGIVNTTL